MLDFNVLFNTWSKVLTRPSVEVFDEEAPKADLTQAIVVMVLTGLVSGLLGGLLRLVFTAGRYGIRAWIIGTIVSPIFYPIVFLIGSGILYLIARALGGQGDFNTQTYLISLFAAPLGMASGVLGPIPLLGGLISLAISIYQLLLLTYALVSAHKYETSKAIITWAIPVGVVLILSICALAFGAATFMGLLFGMRQMPRP